MPTRQAQASLLFLPLQGEYSILKTGPDFDWSYLPSRFRFEFFLAFMRAASLLDMK